MFLLEKSTWYVIDNYRHWASIRLSQHETNHKTAQFTFMLPYSYLAWLRPAKLVIELCVKYQRFTACSLFAFGRFGDLNFERFRRWIFFYRFYTFFIRTRFFFPISLKLFALSLEISRLAVDFYTRTEYHFYDSNEFFIKGRFLRFEISRFSEFIWLDRF